MCASYFELTNPIVHVLKICDPKKGLWGHVLQTSPVLSVSH